MAEITLISGSTLGSAEYVSEHLAEKLEEAGHSTTILHGPLIEDLQPQGIWLVISSTHGAGDIDKLETALKACGAKQIGETLKINVLEHEIPEDPAEIWLGSWKNLL